MTVHAFDKDFVADVVRRFRGLEPDAKPQWGAMTREDVIAHLVQVLKYSMGRTEDVSFRGNWVTKRMIKPLVLKGWLSIPKNVQAPSSLVGEEIRGADLETLQRTLEEYVDRVQAGEMSPKLHPFFGEMDVDEWAQFHVIHFEHHMKQFRV